MTAPRRPFVRLEELLLRHGAITQEQLESAKEEQKKWGGNLGRIFVDLGYVTEELLLRANAHQMGARFVDPAKETLDADVVRALGVQVCEQFGVLAVGGDPRKKALQVATSDPENKEILAHLTKLTGMTIELAVATSASINAAIRRHFYGEALTPVRTTVADAARPSGSKPSPTPEAPRPMKAFTAASLAEPTPYPPARAAGAAPVAVAVSAPATPPAVAGSAELEALAKRVERLESYLGSMQGNLSQQIATDPQIAGLAARLEHLEQISSSDVGSLRAVVELLLERGVFQLEDLKAKVKAVRERGGGGV
ncbi:MAG TPA: hypothetical protein VFA20_04450 [Myxococcaceae bacterium]|nr:hypothetical protein [Myxococcaceae bacterium]